MMNYNKLFFIILIFHSFSNTMIAQEKGEVINKKRILYTNIWDIGNFRIIHKLNAIVFEIDYGEGASADYKQSKSEELGLENENCFLEIFFNNDTTNKYYTSGEVIKDKTDPTKLHEDPREFEWISRIKFNIEIKQDPSYICDLYYKIIKQKVDKKNLTNIIECPLFDDEIPDDFELRKVPPSISNNKIQVGFLYWSAGTSYDLAVPYLGINLGRPKLEIEFQGGLTPWRETYKGRYQRDAFIMLIFRFIREPWYRFKLGFFSGGEFFIDNGKWSTQVIGISVGPTIRIKGINIYIGYNIGRLSLYIESPRLVNSLIISTCFDKKF